MEGAVGHRTGELGGEGAELARVVVEEGGVLVADDPHGLPREGAADGRPVLFGPYQRVLVPGNRPGLGRGNEPSADPHSVGAEGQGRGQPSAVEDPAGRHHGDLGADRVDDLGDQRHGGDQAGVPPGLGPLGDHDVASGVEGAAGMVDLAAHVDDQHVVAVAEIDDVGGNPQAGHEDRRPAVDDLLHLSDQVARHGGEEVDTERLVGGVAHGRDLGHHALVAHGRGAEASEASGFGDRGDQRGIGDATHAGEHDRVVDAQKVGESGPHASVLSL